MAKLKHTLPKPAIADSTMVSIAEISRFVHLQAQIPTKILHGNPRPFPRFSGKIGSLEPGYHFNAIVIDNMEDKGIQLTPAERVERFCYIGDDRNIVARYIDGKAL